MRGLSLFISDLRKCKGKDEELRRVNKELANIRNKFKGDKPLNGYQKKKYICKLVLIFLMGYKCDIGHIESVNLLSSNAYGDKQAGYLFISVVKDEKFNLMPLILNSLKNDLSSSNPVFQNLALQFIANNSSANLADSLADLVTKVLFSNDTVNFVKQSAVLALLHILRIKSDLMITESTINFLTNLILHHDLGLVTASINLIEFLVKKFPSRYECCVTQCIVKLSKLVYCSCIDFRGYTYYSVSAPWICVKLIQILQNFPAPSNASVKIRLRDALEKILRKADEIPKRKKFEHNNAKYAVIFEAISLIIHMEFEGAVLCRAFSVLGATLERKEPNLRFMALELMTRLSNNSIYLERVKLHWNSILNLLSTESDIAMKIRAIDLLYTLCSKDNVKTIVHGILNLLEGNQGFPEDVILKTAAMAEQFSNDKEWYVDAIFNLLHVCGDNVHYSVWHSLIKTVIKDDSIQEYASKVSYAVLCEKNNHDCEIKLAGYILGEFGYIIASDIKSSYNKQFNILKEKYLKCSPSTKALLLTTFLKFYNCYPDMKDEIQLIFKNTCNIQSDNAEIQQRAIEYLKLTEIASASLLASVLDAMPSSLIKVSATVAAIENKKNQKIPVQRTNIRQRGKKVTNLHSYSNINNLAENFKKVHMTKSASYYTQNPSSGYSDSLVDIFNDNSMTNAITDTQDRVLDGSPRISNILNNQSFLQSMLFNEKGKLYENDTIDVDIESEFDKHWGRFHLKYRNKTVNEFSEFSVQGDFTNFQSKCSVWFKSQNCKLPPNGIVEQDVHLECFHVFSERPSLNLKFATKDQCNEVKLILPLTLNKFVEPGNMSHEDFIKRWQTYQSHDKEVKKEFLAQYPMIYGVTRQKLKGFRLAVIEKIESDSENFHCSGIFCTRENRIGFLVQLDRDTVNNRYCSRVRSSQPRLSHVISNLLSELL